MAMNAHRYSAPLLAVLLLAASACASTRVLTVPATASTWPATWSTAAAGVTVGGSADLSTWWQQFGDATLSDLVDRALRGNTDLRTAQARLRQARAERNVTQTGLL